MDAILDGGLHGGEFTQVYGVAASGKTTLALMFVRSAYRAGLSTIYVNTETTLPFARLEQITGVEFRAMSDGVRVLAPSSFEEQGMLIDDLEVMLLPRTGLVVVDTLTGLYRLVLRDRETNYLAHRELNRQAGVLKGLAVQYNIAVLVLNQVRSVPDSREEFEPVARNIMEYWADYTLRFRTGRTPGERVVGLDPPRRGEVHLVLSHEGFIPMTPLEKE